MHFDYFRSKEQALDDNRRIYTSVRREGGAAFQPRPHIYFTTLDIMSKFVDIGLASFDHVRTS